MIVIEAHHGCFDVGDAAQDEALEFKRGWSQILVAVPFLDAAEIAAKRDKQIGIGLDGHSWCRRRRGLVLTWLLPQGATSMHELGELR